jgi:hypothetical protein
MSNPKVEVESTDTPPKMCRTFSTFSLMIEGDRNCRLDTGRYTGCNFLFLRTSPIFTKGESFNDFHR